MSILEKLNKVIMEKDGAAAAEIIHDDYKRYSHLQGTYTESGKTGMIEAINKGLDKGDLKNPGFAQLTLGQALFELQRFNEARDVFTKASKSKKDTVKKYICGHLLLQQLNFSF